MGKIVSYLFERNSNKFTFVIKSNESIDKVNLELSQPFPSVVKGKEFKPGEQVEAIYVEQLSEAYVLLREQGWDFSYKRGWFQAPNTKGVK